MGFVYIFIFAAAIFKDFILDFIGIGSLPAIGTVLTWLTSIFIGFMLLLAGAGGKRRVARNMTKKMMVLIGGTMFESFFFGLNFLPIETVTVFIIYLMHRKENKRAAKKIKKGK